VTARLYVVDINSRIGNGVIWTAGTNSTGTLIIP